MTDLHHPVLLSEVLAALTPADGETLIDATFGRGGYTRAILDAADCRVVGVDRDPAAIAAGAPLRGRYGDRLTLVEGRFGRLDDIAGRLGVSPVDAIAFDLGVSSPQIDTPERGFSFRNDGPLDMRMGSDGPTAADLVNALPEDDLATTLRDLGEERMARRIARAIIGARKQAPIARTGELAEIVRRVVPKARDGIDPATRTFQALRIRVNDELGELDRGLQAAERALGPGGRLAVVAFHSLEDRRVKRFLTERTGAGGKAVSRHLPMHPVQQPAPTCRLISRRPVRPGDTETAANPRARSARLRAAIRTEAPAWATAPVEGVA